MFALIFKLLFSICNIIFYIFYIVSFFIITPLVSIAIFLYSCLCYCLRSIGDCVILSFARCCGRTPNTNSVFTTKISGPDMAGCSTIYVFRLRKCLHPYTILTLTDSPWIDFQNSQRIKISQSYETFKKILKAII